MTRHSFPSIIISALIALYLAFCLSLVLGIYRLEELSSFLQSLSVQWPL